MAIGAARWPLRLASSLVVVVALALTALAVWGTRAAVHDQSTRLLKERTSEVGLVLQQAIDAIPTSMQELGALLTATSGRVEAFDAAAQQQADASPTPISLAWLRPVPSGGFRVVAAGGAPDLTVGQVLTGPRARTLHQAMTVDQVVPTPVIGSQRMLGFALGPPAAPGGTVLYRQTTLGPVVSPPRAAATAPFSELDVVVYSGLDPRSSAVLTATTSHLPLRGQVRRKVLTVGATRWLMAVRARGPLVGRLTADAPWLVLAAGLAGTVLLALAVETVARRRDAAIELYRAEHHVAETLQRSLLPNLPHLPGLELAARYLASGLGQQVGGDWFDVFPIAGDRCGIVVGDVVGHDVAAASAMAEIRALLRGYAVDGEPPAAVLTRLSRVIDILQVTPLVTVFYGVLEPPRADGSRVLQYGNAGHMPPVLRHPDGSVMSLSGGTSPVIGAPGPSVYAQAEQELLPGSVLTLFTDGLVEVPGGSLTEGLDRLSRTVASMGEKTPEDMCEELLADLSGRSLRDDVALLVVRVAGPAGHGEPVIARRTIPAWP